MENKVEKLITILNNKVEEGLEELPKMSVKTEDFTICLNNTLSAIDLVNRLQYKPQPKQANVTPIKSQK